MNYYFVNVIESNTSIFTVFIYPWLDSLVVAAENSGQTYDSKMQCLKNCGLDVHLGALATA